MRKAGLAGLMAAIAMGAGGVAAADRKWTAQEWASCTDPKAMVMALKGLVSWSGGKDRKPLVLTVCECARLALPSLPKNYLGKPQKALEGMENAAREAEGSTGAARNAYDSLLRDVPYFNDPSVPSIRVVISAYIAVAFAGAAATIDNSADAVEAAVYSLERAADSVASATGNPDDYAGTLAKCADIVRKHFPEPPKGER
jgi:hypothetical protein